MKDNIAVNIEQIGIIKTPYEDKAPFQPIDNDKEEFCIIINEQYRDGMKKLKTFKYIYIIYYLNQIKIEKKMLISPPWAEKKEIGVFASRSPMRPNQIGLSIVKIKKIIDNRIYTSGLDVFNNTPLLDIKPYIKDLDNKTDANNGWVNELNDDGHLALHINGIPHNY